MGPAATLRSRRSAAQRHALARVEREIRASDPHGRRKYLRDFADAFRAYQSVLNTDQLCGQIAAANLVLVADYHALPAAQNYAAKLVEQLASRRKPVALGLEMLFVRDQHIVDEWMAENIGEEELRERIRFDADWGYPWQPYYELLRAGRQHAFRIFGLDCTPRNDLRKISTRDRHAADKLAEIRERHPEALVVALFGESHLAPNHLPALLRARRPQDRVFTVLQNVDALYWRAAGEPRDRVEAVRVDNETVCVFTSTPLEKYESYRQCLDRWRQEGPAAPDFAPSIYNLIEALLKFLNINRYAAQNHTQPRFLVDLLPEIHCRPKADQLQKLLSRAGVDSARLRSVLAGVEARGTYYVPTMNSIFVGEWQMAYAAEEAARFVHHACRGSLDEKNLDQERSPEDRFYRRVFEDALAYLGSRVLCPDRCAVRGSELYGLYARSREEIEEQISCSHREYLEMIDFLVLHKDYEANHRRYRAVPPVITQGLRYRGEKFDYVTRRLGYMLGSGLYDAYIAGRVAKRFFRGLFFRDMDAPGAAQAAYYAAVRKIAKRAFSS